MKKTYKYIWLLPVFVFIQVLILNEVQFLSYINPLFYITLIIILPQNTQKWFLLVFSFILGLMIDLFENNLGLHASASVLLAFMKPKIEKISIQKNSIDLKEEMNLQILGIRTFSIYTVILIIIHHGYIFLLQSQNINNHLLIKTIFSSIITYVLIIIVQLFIFKEKK